jgi:hypothetical protein
MGLDVEHIPVFPVACVSPSQSLLLIARTDITMQSTRSGARHFTLTALQSSRAFAVQPNTTQAPSSKRRLYRNPKASFARVWDAKEMGTLSCASSPMLSTVSEVLPEILTNQMLEEVDPFLVPTLTTNTLPTASALFAAPATATAEEFDPFLEQPVAAAVLPELATESTSKPITATPPTIMSLPVFQALPEEERMVAPTAVLYEAAPEADAGPEAPTEAAVKSIKATPEPASPAPTIMSLPVFQALPEEIKAQTAPEMAAPTPTTMPEVIDEADPISTAETSASIAPVASLEAFAEPETLVLKPYPTPNLSIFGDNGDRTFKEHLSESMTTFGSILSPTISHNPGLDPGLEFPKQSLEVTPASSLLAMPAEDGAEASAADPMPDTVVDDAAVDSTKSLAEPSSDFPADFPPPPVLKPKPPMDLEASAPEAVVAPPPPPKEKLIAPSLQFTESKYPEGISADEVGRILKALGTDPAKVLDYADCLKMDGDLTARKHLAYAVLQLPEEKWRVVADTLPTKSLGVLVETGYGLLIARHNKTLQQVVIDLEHVHHERVGQAFNSAIAFSKEEAPVLVSMQAKPKSGLKRLLGL